MCSHPSWFYVLNHHLLLNLLTALEISEGKSFSLLQGHIKLSKAKFCWIFTPTSPKNRFGDTRIQQYMSIYITLW